MIASVECPTSSHSVPKTSTLAVDSQACSLRRDASTYHVWILRKVSQRRDEDQGEKPKNLCCDAVANIENKLAPPKAKYVEHILVATHAGEPGVADVFRALQNRLRDSTWTIVFKALIIVHLMIREGEPNVTLKYVAESPSKLAISNFSDGTSKEYNMVSARGPTECGSTCL